jgi:hypothetical protein
MGFTRHFFPEYNFAFTQCYGVIDDNTLRIHILSYNIEAKGMRKVRELADARSLEKADKVSVQGLVRLSDLNAERKAGKGGLLAIVVATPFIYEMARVYATSIKANKKDIGIFYDVNEALSWLGYNGQESDKLLKFMNRHRA